MKKCGPHWIAWLLVIIGGINWGLIGLGYFLSMNLNVVQLLLASWAPAVVEPIVYLVVGIATVFVIFDKKCQGCRVEGTSPVAPTM